MLKKEPYPSDKLDKFLLRLPDGMRQELSEIAKNNHRTITAEIINRIQNSLIQDDSQKVLNEPLGIKEGSYENYPPEAEPYIQSILSKDEFILVSAYRETSLIKKKALLDLLK